MGNACTFQGLGFLLLALNHKVTGVHVVFPGEEARGSLEGGREGERQPGNVRAHSRNPAWPPLASRLPRAAARNAGPSHGGAGGGFCQPLPAAWPADRPRGPQPHAPNSCGTPASRPGCVIHGALGKRKIGGLLFKMSISKPGH